MSKQRRLKNLDLQGAVKASLRKPLQRFACLSALAATCLTLGARPALADCLTPAQMRAMTVTLADLASERVVKHCTALEGAPATFMSSQPAAVTTHFDPLRDAAADVLIQKYAPFLASRKSMALKTVEPIIGLMIDEFGLEDMNANACRQMDITIEAFSTLEPDQSADVLTVFLSRAAQMEGNAMMQPCEVSQAQQ